MRILPHFLSAIRAQEEESTILVKVIFKGELSRSFYVEILSYHALI